jgi:hypothetical protein
VEPADRLGRVAQLEGLAAKVERLARRVSSGELDLEPDLLEALDRLDALTSEIRAEVERGTESP